MRAPRRSSRRPQEPSGAWGCLAAWRGDSPGQERHPVDRSPRNHAQRKLDSEPNLPGSWSEGKEAMQNIISRRSLAWL